MSAKTNICVRLHFVESRTAVSAILKDRRRAGVGRFPRIPVLSSCSESWLIQIDFIPSGYECVVASFGPNSPNNVIGLREHPYPL